MPLPSSDILEPWSSYNLESIWTMRLRRFHLSYHWFGNYHHFVYKNDCICFPGRNKASFVPIAQNEFLVLICKVISFLFIYYIYASYKHTPFWSNPSGFLGFKPCAENFWEAVSEEADKLLFLLLYLSAMNVLSNSCFIYPHIIFCLERPPVSHSQKKIKFGFISKQHFISYFVQELMFCRIPWTFT